MGATTLTNRQYQAICAEELRCSLDPALRYLTPCDVLANDSNPTIVTMESQAKVP